MTLWAGSRRRLTRAQFIRKFGRPPLFYFYLKQKRMQRRVKP